MKGNPPTCQPDANMFMCPCSDSTSGFTTSGVCIAQVKCQAQSTGGGSITQLSQLMSTIGQLLQSLGQGGGGGGGGSGSGTGSTCTTYYQTGDPTKTSDPCAYYVPGLATSSSNLVSSGLGSTDNGSGAANDLISSLIGSGNSNTVDNSNTNSNTDNTTSGSIVPSASSSAIASVTAVANPQALTPGTSATVSQSAFGNAPGVTGDIQVLSGNRVTMLASNRDIAGNTQTSGFYGFNTAVDEGTAAIYSQTCAAREWASNFLTFIIPATYLDTLCSSHGYAVGPPKLQPATPPPAPSSASAHSTATSTPQYLGPMSADIWASPTSVTSGSRASIFWNAKGVLTCAVSNDSGVMASALSGNASTLPLTKTTTYSIACQSATSSVSNRVTVTVQ
jgi:hypothetical protein